jgi:hypothetical protein
MDKEWFQGLTTDEAREERGLLRRRIALVVLGTLLLAVLTAPMHGCATATVKPPECEDLEIHRLDTARGPLFALDLDGVRALSERFRQLQHGECRLPAHDKPEA